MIHLPKSLEPLTTKQFCDRVPAGTGGNFSENRDGLIRRAIGLLEGTLGRSISLRGGLKMRPLRARVRPYVSATQGSIWAVYGPGDHIVPERWIEAYLSSVRDAASRFTALDLRARRM